MSGHFDICFILFILRETTSYEFEVLMVIDDCHLHFQLPNYDWFLACLSPLQKMPSTQFKPQFIKNILDDYVMCSCFTVKKWFKYLYQTSWMTIFCVLVPLHCHLCFKLIYIIDIYIYTHTHTCNPLYHSQIHVIIYTISTNRMTKTNYSSIYCLNNPWNSEYIRHIGSYILSHAWVEKDWWG